MDDSYDYFQQLVKNVQANTGFGKPRFDRFIPHAPDLERLQVISGGLGLPSSLEALKRQNYCKLCRWQLAGCDVCIPCKATPEGRKLVDMEIGAKAARTKIARPKAAKELEKERRRATTQQRYGVDNSLQSPLVRAKINATVTERYGGHHFTNAEILAKRKETYLERFGVDNPAKAKEVKDKIAKTNQVRYGAPVYIASKVGVQASLATQRLEYVGGHSSRDPRCNALRRSTNLERHGTEYPMQSPEVFRKAQSKLHTKKTVFINGIPLKVAGYEGIVLKKLEPKIDRVAVKPRSMPPIWWVDGDGKTHRYFADALVQLKNGRKLLLEVKSSYTIRGGRVIEKAIAAWKFCEDRTLEYLVVLVDKQKLTWISDPTKLRQYANHSS